MSIEPRKRKMWESATVYYGATATCAAPSRAAAGPTGVLGHSVRTEGTPRNLGGLVVSSENAGDTPLNKSWPIERARDRWERTYEPAEVLRSEGNEATRNGRRGIGARHSTDEAGGHARWTLRRKGRAGNENCERER